MSGLFSGLGAFARDIKLAHSIFALPFALAGDDDRYQAEVLRLAPAPKFSPRQAARGED